MTDTAAAEAATDTPVQTLEQTLDALFAPYNRSDQPGLVVGVAQHGKVLLRKGYGLASIEQGAANTPRTRMRIGSTSKQFACLAAFLLAEEGKLDPDAPADILLPELADLPRPAGQSRFANAATPTLRQFMNHTSGYRDSTDMGALAAGMGVLPAGRALAAQFRQSEPNFAPGEGQLYCNGGYHLLCHAISRAAGMDFAEVLKTRIFDPLGMADTALEPSDMNIIPGMATLHVPTPTGGWRRGLLPAEDILGEGSIVSTIDDMLIWQAHLRAPTRIGSAATWAQMQTTAVLNNGLATPYAAGLMLYDYRGLATIGHDGGVPGGSCGSISIPEQALDIIVMANGGPANVGELKFKIIDAVIGEEALAAPVPMAQAKGFEHLDGVRYHNAESGNMFVFGVMGDMLGVGPYGIPAMPVLRDAGDAFRIGFEHLALGPLVWAKADLAADAQGKAPATITISECGTQSIYTRVDGPAPDAATAAAVLAGAYRCADLDADAVIALADGALTLTIEAGYGASIMPLTPLADTLLLAGIAAMPGMAIGMTVLADGSGFILTGIRTRHLRFVRTAH